jgi:hypothetical protein
MLPLLLLLFTTQAPAVPGETTLVSFCKQGRLAACEELKKLFPEHYAEVQAELAKAALRLETLRVAEEAARDDADANTARLMRKSSPGLSATALRLRSNS